MKKHGGIIEVRKNLVIFPKREDTNVNLKNISTLETESTIPIEIQKLIEKYPNLNQGLEK